MLLSIVTINFNNLDGLKKTIESVVSQTWKEFEWIIVDGGSNDGSRELIKEYSDKGFINWWCSEKDNGIYNALNKGTIHASGDYIQYLNSGDSLYSRDTLFRIFGSFKLFDSDIIYGNAMLSKDNKFQLQIYPSSVSLGYFYWNTINHQASFIKRDFLLKLGKYDENYKICSDWKFWVQSCINQANFVYINQTLVFFDISGVSANHSALIDKERNEILSNLLPSYIITDLNYIKKRGILEMFYPELVQIQNLYLSRRLYHRIFHCVLVLVLAIDRILSFFNKIKR